jgi:hypothetical protein
MTLEQEQIESMTWRVFQNDSRSPFAVVTDANLTITQFGKGCEAYGVKKLMGRKLIDLWWHMQTYYPTDIRLLHITPK